MTWKSIIKPTREEIDKKYTEWHDRITKAYYVDKTMSKKDFEKEHAECWSKHEEDLVKEGYRKCIWTYTFEEVIGGNIIPTQIIIDRELTQDEISQIEAKKGKLKEVSKSSIDIRVGR